MENNVPHLLPSEILDHLKSILGVENDNQLAKVLNVERQRIRQYRIGKGSYMTCRMMTLLIEAHQEAIAGQTKKSVVKRNPRKSKDSK